MRIQKYKGGYRSIKNWGYTIKRGQNLQESQIGKSIYSSEKQDNYYSLIRPTNFTEYGTVEKLEYLGNPKQLSCIEIGDIAFSGEGTVGKCVLFSDINARWITNIHGIILNKESHDIKESAFVASFLRYLRAIGYFDYVSVGGQGGSLAKKYWEDIIVPNFPTSIKNRIADLYCNSIAYPKSTPITFKAKDSEWEAKAGIIELDAMNKKIKCELNCILDSIIHCEDIDISASIAKLSI